ncbi:MAG TPA: oxygen-independent coproporphyrinogen III oxidase [bacterium]|nr:oxygen-independent coproporphyrinogen III oxidase [bacterium]
MADRLAMLLKKYDVAGPRYTSYPTAPAWTNSVGEGDFRKSLSSLKSGEPLSLYFHVPFCETLCHFCGCMKIITKDHARSRRYVDVLLTELDRIASLIPGAGGQVSQMHFGGGSPNYLQPDELKDVVDRTRARFRFEADAEIAIEMHPRTSTPEFCEMTARLGFNRISLGVQDFDPVVQKLINRHQTYEMTADMVALLRRLGFTAFNFDLIYGLPGQTIAEWTKTLNQVIGLRPNRLAVYSYAHVPWLKPYQRSFEDKDLPSPELKLRLFETAYRTLTAGGYQPIGMDHFALADDDLAKAHKNGTIHRNFMGYSTKADAHQIGFGLSSISYADGNYFQNHKDMEAYEAAIRAGGLATQRGYLLNRDDHVRRELIRQIMCRGVAEIPAFEKDWGIVFADYFKDDLPHLGPMIADGLVTLDSQALRVVHEGHLFLRNVAMAFDRHLEEIKSTAKNPVFSRTV